MLGFLDISACACMHTYVYPSGYSHDEYKTRNAHEQLPLLTNLGGLQGQEVTICINIEVITHYQIHNQPTCIGVKMYATCTARAQLIL